jgi:hypothetical protein
LSRERRRRLPRCDVLEDRTVPSALTDLGQLPLAFEPNVGQADAAVRFLARGSGYSLFLTDSEAVLALSPANAASGQDAVLRLQLVSANAAPAVAGLAPQAGVSNYLLGNDPAQWQTNVAHFGQVTYGQVYAGIDLLYHGSDQHQLEYDFAVAPGADARQIGLRVAGALGLALDGQGNLVLHTAAGDVVEQAPVAYQDGAGGRVAVAAAYLLRGDGTVGFQVGAYDSTQALVIDPVLSYSTYLGGSGGDFGIGIAVDGAGNAYVTGYTQSADFPTASPLQPAHGVGQNDAFVAKLSASGSLVYSTYLGGGGDDYGLGIAMDGAGNAYVTGYTNSTNFPIAAPLQSANAGGFDAFVSKLNAAGSALVYSTYLGGSGGDFASGIAVDGAGSAYVAGATNSANFPMTAGAFDTALNGGNNGGNNDAFVAKLSAAGSSLIYSTYLGGSSNDQATDIAVDSAGNAYVTGFTFSSNFPTVNPAEATFGGGPEDAFVAKLNNAGSALLFSTYLGGSGDEQGQGVAVDGSGNTYITGFTSSTDFPTRNALQPALAGVRDAFVAKLSASGNALVYSTYLGGSDADLGQGIAVDGSGNAVVIGWTSSADFPTADALQPTYAGNQDAFVAKLNPSGSALIYSTFLGGTGAEQVSTVAVDAAGNAYVIGNTTSTDFPTANAVQGANHGIPDVFVAKLGPGPLIYTAPAGASHSLLLGRDGPNLRLMDDGVVVATRLLSETSGVLLYGNANEPDSLTIDNSAGLIELPDGVRFDGGAGGGNTVFLVGTPGGDSFTLYPAGFNLDGVLAGAVFNVQSVTAYSGPGDAAWLYDGPGNDVFVATPGYAYLQAGASTSIVSGFASVQATSAAGSDLALLYDSPGSDVFLGTPTYSSLAGSGFANVAAGFAQVRAYSSGGGDVANLYDAAGNDVFRGTPNYSYLEGSGFLNLVAGFANVNAFAGAGGSDTADLYDSPGNDTFSGQDSVGVLQGPGYRLGTSHFTLVRATSSAGGFDQLSLGAIDYVFEQIGAWH